MTHTYNQEVIKLQHRNLVVIDGKAIEFKDLPKEKREKLTEEWNRRALEAIGYKRVGTAQSGREGTSYAEMVSL